MTASQVAFFASHLRFVGAARLELSALAVSVIAGMISNLFASGNIPNFLVPVIFFVMAGVITLFSNFTVIYPLLFPLVPVVAGATGINSVTLFTAVCLGSGLPGVSPFSTGGACCISGCPDEATRTKLIPRQFVMSIVILIITIIILLTPIVRIFPEVM